jgi:hypothetical protein
MLLALKVAAACSFLLCVCMCLMQILTKFQCPEWKTFWLAGILKGVCHEIFQVLFWHVWIDLGLYKNL